MASDGSSQKPEIRLARSVERLLGQDKFLREKVLNTIAAWFVFACRARRPMRCTGNRYAVTYDGIRWQMTVLENKFIRIDTVEWPSRPSDTKASSKISRPDRRSDSPPTLAVARPDSGVDRRKVATAIHHCLRYLSQDANRNGMPRTAAVLRMVAHLAVNEGTINAALE